MDISYQKEVEKAFIKLYNAGLIYRGERLINWCTRCETSLSNDEVNDKDITNKLYYIKYQLEDNII